MFPSFFLKKKFLNYPPPFLSTPPAPVSSPPFGAVPISSPPQQHPSRPVFSPPPLRHRSLLPFRHCPPPFHLLSLPQHPFLTLRHLLSSSTPPAPSTSPFQPPASSFLPAPFDQTGPNGGPWFGHVWPNGGPPFGETGPNIGPPFDPVWSNGGGRKEVLGAEEGRCRRAGEGRQERAGARKQGKGSREGGGDLGEEDGFEEGKGGGTEEEMFRREGLGMWREKRRVV